jgi:cytochrome c-type biogenesis protein CcsB
MNTLDVTFFWIAFWFYFIGFLFFTAYLASDKKIIPRMGTAFMIIGFIPQTVAIILRWLLSGHPPFTNMFEYMTVMSWMAVGTFIFIIFRFKKPIVGSFIAPVTFILMVSASLLPKQISQQLMPALQDIWLYIHVSLAAVGEGAFAVAFGVSIMYLIGERMEASGGGQGKPSRWPSLDTLDSINYKSISIGFPLFTVGALFAGAIWANKAWGTFWGWDPKEVGSLIIWIFYILYLHARYQRGWQGRKAAILSIIGFIMVMLSFFGNLFLGGDHAYG